VGHVAFEEKEESMTINFALAQIVMVPTKSATFTFINPLGIEKYMRHIVLLISITLLELPVKGQSVAQLDSLIEKAHYYDRLGNFRAEIRVLDSALALTSDIEYQTMLLVEKGNCYYNLQHMDQQGVAHYDTALVLVNRALSLDSSLSNAIHLRARIFADQGRAPDSIDELTSAITISPKDPFLYMERGLNYLSLKKKKHAKNDFLKAKEIALAEKYGTEIFEWINGALMQLKL
jgi:tetratricopeptide (TPR) repeat protein